MCGTTRDVNDVDETWLACSSCGCWQHSLCMGIKKADGKSLSVYNCEQCDPNSHKELLKAIDRLGNQAAQKDGPQGLTETRGQRPRDQQSLIQENSIRDTGEAFTQEGLTPSHHLTDECHHYTSIKEVPWDIQKYVEYRSALFSWSQINVHQILAATP
jgi:hypothetical protein